jgi:hypothetical protein
MLIDFNGPRGNVSRGPLKVNERTKGESMKSYYASELKALKDGNFPKSVKIFDGEGNQTKQLDLNAESIPVLIEYLKREKVAVKARSLVNGK